MNDVSTGAKTTLEQSEFKRGAAFGTTGNESAAVPTYGKERSSAPAAQAQPCYGSLKRTEYGTPPPNWTPTTANAGKDSM